jgi:hypothetical protein
MINKTHLINYVIKPTLQKMSMYSKEAEQLLLVTAAIESVCGTYLHQIRGPALGIYQMEPETYHDVWNSVLHFSPKKTRRIKLIYPVDEIPHQYELMGNINYATAIARIYYSRFAEPIPKCGSMKKIVDYYYRYWKPNPEKLSLESAITLATKILGRNIC